MTHQINIKELEAEYKTIHFVISKGSTKWIRLSLEAAVSQYNSA